MPTSRMNLKFYPHTKYWLRSNNPGETFTFVYFTCEHSVVEGQESGPHSEFAVWTVGLFLCLLGLVDQPLDCFRGQVSGALVFDVHHFHAELHFVHPCLFHGWLGEWVCCCSALDVNGKEGRATGRSHSQSRARMSTCCAEATEGPVVLLPLLRHASAFLSNSNKVSFGRVLCQFLIWQTDFLVAFVPYLLSVINM